MEKTCFLFGHRNAPSCLTTAIEDAASQLYLHHGVRDFIVGSRGDFDSMAAAALKQLKKEYPDIRLQLLIAYHPAEHPVHLVPGFDSTFYPPLETVPRQYAIVKANQYMVKNCDMVICYVWHTASNTQKLLAQALRRKIAVINLSEEIKP